VRYLCVHNEPLPGPLPVRRIVLHPAEGPPSSSVDLFVHGAGLESLEKGRVYDLTATPEKE
jgi:hypothetical protein